MNRFEENAIKAVLSRFKNEQKYVFRTRYLRWQWTGKTRIHIFGDKIGSRNEAWVIIAIDIVSLSNWIEALKNRKIDNFDLLSPLLDGSSVHICFFFRLAPLALSL